MIRHLKLIPALVDIYVRSRLEYRGAMLLAWLSQGMAYSSVYAAIALIIWRFDNLGGWVWPEMALLLSFHLLAYSLGAAMSFVQFRDVEGLVQRGMFDAILVKPVSPWVYLAFSGLNIGYGGHVILAVALMAWAVVQLGPDWQAGHYLYLLITLCSGAMVVCAIMTMIGATAMVWVRSRHLYSIFFGFWELARYPLNIFPGVLQLLMLTIVPLGFMSYVPVAVVLGKDVALLGDWAGPASLLAGPVAVVIAMAHWRYCLRNYQGAGG